MLNDRKGRSLLRSVGTHPSHSTFPIEHSTFNIQYSQPYDMSEVIYLTRERIRELEDEIQRLKTHERKEIAQKIAEARSYGDLSENAEYDAAREAQGLLEARIYKLEQTIARARIIDAGNL